MTDLSLPKDFPELVESKRPPRDPHRFYACAVCGQQVDRVNLAQVFHHTSEPHEPLADQP